MNALPTTRLSPSDFALYQTTRAFIETRLGSRDSIEWALDLETGRTAERLGVIAALNSTSAVMVQEPWMSAWRLIEESWSFAPIDEHHAVEWHPLLARVIAGDRSGALVNEIVQLVRPRIKTTRISMLRLKFDPPRAKKKPKAVSDLMDVAIVSARSDEMAEFDWAGVEDSSFLIELSNALDGAILRGVDVARRLGWQGKAGFWRLGDLHRVYFLRKGDRADDEHEPDEFQRGIAPATKTFHAAVARLLHVDRTAGLAIVERVRHTSSSIHLRLWAKFACDQNVVPPADVHEFLLRIGDREFWDVNEYPEIAELRALRFNSLPPQAQATITHRIERGPPNSLWSKRIAPADLLEAKAFAFAKEVRRIQIAGGSIKPKKLGRALSGRALDEINALTRIDSDFRGTPRARSVEFERNDSFGLLRGNDLLDALEDALRSAEDWRTDSASSARHWITDHNNFERLVEGLEDVLAVKQYPLVWDALGWVSPTTIPEDKRKVVAGRVLALISALPQPTVRSAIGGISNWFSDWSRYVEFSDRFATAWLMAWPLAAADSNSEDVSDIAPQYVVEQSKDDDARGLDTLNTPVGKMVGAFLTHCPDLTKVPDPFTDFRLRQLRDAAASAQQRAGLIGLYRMIELLPWFLRADRAWTVQHLLEPLISSDQAALPLWRAVGQRTRFHEVLKSIGGVFLLRAQDARLARDTRKSLVFSVVVDVLHSFKAQRTPAFPIPDIQQLLRNIEDEIRASAAETLHTFQVEIPGPDFAPEVSFDVCIAPFLGTVWPREASLTSRGVAKALADLPSACGQRFVQAVQVIMRFVVPFDCWSMIDFGFYGEVDGHRRIQAIDTADKARAFLQLLDASVGATETAIVPLDLGDALDQIRKMAPGSAKTSAFKRLEAAVRR